MHRRRTLGLIWLLTGAAFAQNRNAAPLTPGNKIPLPRVQGRIDHFAADVRGQRLFVSALGNGTVEVIDVKEGRRTQSLGGFKEPQGVLYLAEADKLFVASGGDGTVKVYDGQSFKQLNAVKVGEDADNLRSDAEARHVIVGYGDGALGILDWTGKQVKSIPLSGHPESFQLEHQGARIFVNVPRRESVVALDQNSGTAKSWPVTAAKANFPMAVNEPDGRLFVGCRHPAKLLVLELANGKLVAQLDTVGDTDDLFFDAGRKRVYVIGGQGAVEVFKQKDEFTFQSLGRVPTAEGARTGLFVPEWNRLFVAAPRRGSQEAAIYVFDTR